MENIKIMQRLLSLITLVCVIIISVGCEEEEFTYKLEQLQVIFRHGDKTPEEYECFPTDLNKNLTFDNYKRAQLTDEGKSRASNLGEILRKFYGKFLDDYESGNVRGYSTNYVHTRVSLEEVLKSLYPTEEKIPIMSNNRINDYYFQSFDCPKFNELLYQTKQLPKVKNELEKYKKFFKFLSDNTGFDVDLKYAFLIATTLQAYQRYDLPLPDWCNEDTVEELNNITDLFYKIYSYTPEMQKIIIGPLLRKIMSNLKDNHTDDNLKIVLYSSYDATIKFLSRALDLKNQKNMNTEFGSAIIIQKLRGSDDEIYIRILFYPGIDNLLYPKKLRNCDMYCPYDEFLNITNPATASLSDLKRTCKSDKIYVNDALVIMQNKC